MALDKQRTCTTLDKQSACTTTPITCSSAEPHENEVRDLVLHYFDCIEICDRRKFFDNSPIWEQEKENVIKEFRNDPKFTAQGEVIIAKEAREAVENKKSATAIAIEAEYTRTDILVDAINVANRDSPEKCQNNLVTLMRDSHQAWKNSEDFKHGIPLVREWRTKHKKSTSNSTPPTPQNGIPEERKRVQLIKKEREESLNSTWNTAWDEDKPAYSVLRDVNAYVIQYDTKSHAEPRAVSESPKDLRFKGKFPDQRIALTYLLKNSDSETGWDSILSKENNPERIRYFHVPSNNMAWVEKVMARYFDEDDLEFDTFGGPKRGNSSRRTHMLLRNEYWRGQQHGGGKTLIHTRHMKALCERVSSDKPEIHQTPKNLVLFMPYLHWETDSSRERMSKVLEKQVACHRKNTQDRLREEREARKKTYEGLERPKRPVPKHPDVKESPEKPQGLVRSMTDMLDAIFHPKSRTKDDKTGTLIFEHGRMKPNNTLGQFLYDSAKLYQAILMLRDEKITEEYLYHDAPLHPRRTLDQYYYGTMTTTKHRDRDQVVYRGTAMDVQRAHKFTEAEAMPTKSLFKSLPSKSFFRKSQPEAPRLPKSTNDTETRIWSDHTSIEDEHGCEHCRADICKVSRVVMVDQLWMWILDEKTIITFFPKMYGVNKRDPSGVHKCIRDRLRAADKDQIRSVYDLALVILDECSNTFFDRTKTQERQPQTIDIFSEAIGTVNYRATRAFKHLWHWTERAGEIYRSKQKHVEAMDLHVPLLDIFPEGQLQKEIKDIIDELGMMLHVQKKQKEVIKRFSKNVEHILDPPGKWRNDQDSSATNWYDGRTPPVPKTSSGASDDDGHKKFDWFRLQAFELLSDVTDRIDELEDLKKEAEGTAQTVKDLLDLKQQQASVVQAWQAVNQADETVSQGRSIMMFTIVTIVFLPLSFISSVFGMNNSDFGSNWTFHQQALYYMFPISAGIIFVTLLLAFSDLCRAVLWWLWVNISTIFIVKTRLYRFWLSVRGGPQYKMLTSVEKRIRKMKENVKRAKFQRKADRKAAENKPPQEGEDGTKWPQVLWQRNKKSKPPTANTKNSGTTAMPLPASTAKSQSVTKQDFSESNGHDRPAQTGRGRALTVPMPKSMPGPSIASPATLATSTSAPDTRLVVGNGTSAHSGSAVSIEDEKSLGVNGR